MSRLRFERETGLIVTDDDKAVPVLILASSQTSAVGYKTVDALNSHDALRAALEHVVANVELAPKLPLTTLDIAGIRAALSSP